MALRFKNEAPFRCRACGLRFVAKTEPDASGGARGPLSFADYLGLRGWTRRLFTDQMILGSVLGLLLLLVTVVFFAFAFGWIDPFYLHTTSH